MDITINSSQLEEFINITDLIRKAVKDSQVNNGILLVYVPHTTAAVTVTENTDKAVQHDILDTLDKLVPKDELYKHKGGNSFAHIKSSIMGSSHSFVIENGTLKLGKWQNIYFCEFDGPRKRNIYVTVK